jgi:hypothetical protein
VTCLRVSREISIRQCRTCVRATLTKDTIASHSDFRLGPERAHHTAASNVHTPVIIACREQVQFVKAQRVTKPLLKYAFNRFSQFGEDGIIEELCRRLGIKNGWFVEFGAWDGKHLSNTHNLVRHHGWQGVYIEGDPAKYESLLLTQKEFPGRLHTLCAMVGCEGEHSLDNLLARTPLPAEFDLLSVDIDSYDWQVWKSLTHYRPKIVVIESNGILPPGVLQVHNPPHSFSTSFSSLVELGRAKGYQLVCHTGNCLFVRNELVGALRLDPLHLEHPEKLFHYNRYLKEKLLARARKILPRRAMNWVFDASYKIKRLRSKR